jgi:hypothetical protein
MTFLAITAGNAAEELWKNCSTPTTDYVLQVPGSLVRSTGPGVTGCTYQSADGEFNVEAAERPDDQKIEERMQKEISLLSGTVTYQTRGETWFVLSGVTPDGTEYYRKHYTNGGQWVTLRITYPHSKNKRYNKWVTRIEKSFVAFGNAQQNTGTDHNKATPVADDNPD